MSGPLSIMFFDRGGCKEKESKRESEMRTLERLFQLINFEIFNSLLLERTHTHTMLHSEHYSERAFMEGPPRS